MLARGFSREASGPPSPGEPPASAEDHLAIRKMKALLSKQYRTTRVDPLHSYLATNRILQLIYDIACIYEREGSVKLAARRGTKRSPSAKGSSLSNDRPDFPGGSTFWAPRHNCRHARRPFFAFAMMSPPPSPLFLLGGRPYLSVVTHTHPVHVHVMSCVVVVVVVRAWGGSAAKRAARPPQASRPHPRRTILRSEK